MTRCRTCSSPAGADSPVSHADSRLTPWEWPAALFRVARDRAYESFGTLPAARDTPAGRYFSSKLLGLGCRHNGSRGYVLYHGNFFDPRTYAGLEQGGIAWIRADELARFNREILPRLERPIVLVTAECDWSVPRDTPAECETLARSGRIRRWFANNPSDDTYGDLLTPLPIGVNYSLKHTLSRTGDRPDDHYYRDDAIAPVAQDAIWAAAAAVPLAARRPLAFGDFCLNNSSRSRRFGESRADIHAALRPSGCVVFPERRLPPGQLVAAYGRHAFVVSPHGNGLDCYRTWLALICGCIVIVKRSPLDRLYANLPVVIVERWDEVTPANLGHWLGRFGPQFDRTRLQQVLSLAYWQAELARVAAGP